MERERTNHEYAQRELAKKNVVTIRKASPASHGEADIVLQLIAIEEQARQERQERRYRRETLNAFQDISRAIRGEPRPQRSFYGVPIEYIFGDSY